MNRRDFIKNTAIASAASVAGLSVPSSMLGAQEEDWKWDKAVCRFCGTGCGIMIARKDGKIVATKGDPAAPVNADLIVSKVILMLRSCMVKIVLLCLCFA